MDDIQLTPKKRAIRAGGTLYELSRLDEPTRTRV